VVAASDAYVRVLIRRPHAYFFLNDLFEDQGGVKSATPEGCTLADGTNVPLPGIYVLDADGDYEASSSISKTNLLELLEQNVSDDQSE